MSEWVQTKLADLIDIKHGFAFPGVGITDQPNSNLLVTPGNFNIGGGFKSSKFKYYNGEFPLEYKLHPGDVVVTMTDLSQETDTLGYSACIPNIREVNYLHNQRIGLVTLNSDKAVLQYIYWLLRTQEYQSYIVSTASGTSIMHTSPSRIKDYVFLLPSFSEQQSIAEVLSSLDDKIDLLQRQNKTLEELAETLFRQWFIEKAEECWEEGYLSDFVDIKYGKDHQKLLDGNIPVFGSGGLMRKVNKSIYEKESVLIPRKGTLSNILFVDEPFWTVDTMFYTVMKRENISKFIYHTLKKLDLASMNVGSAVPSMTTEILNSLPLRIPNDSVLDKFEKQASFLYLKQKANLEQINQIQAIRDTLLPKLMSGAVRVAK